MLHQKKKISTNYEIALAFFLGAAISSIAQDPSDVLFFYAKNQGWLNNGVGATFWWYWSPFLLYFSFFLIGLVLAHFTHVGPVFLFALYGFAVIASSIYSFFLPQAAVPFFMGTVILATVISMAVIVDMILRMNHNFAHHLLKMLFKFGL